jgi:hypothetical protein
MFIGGDVSFGVVEDLFEGQRSSFKEFPHEDPVIGSSIEVLNHYHLKGVGMRFLVDWNRLRNERRDSLSVYLMDLRSHGCAGLSKSDESW